MSPRRERHPYWTIVTVVVLSAIVLVVLIITTIDNPMQRLREEEPQNINALLDEFLAQIPEEPDTLQLSLRPEALRGFNAGLISRDNDPLRVRLSKPAGTSFPGVIIVHDAPSSEPQTDVSDVELGQPLVDAVSVATFTVDWRSHDGDRNGHIRDVLSAVDWVEKLAPTNNETPVILLGIGYGAALALDAAQQQEAVDGLVLVDMPATADRTVLTTVSATIPVLEWSTSANGALATSNDNGVMIVADGLVSWLYTVQPSIPTSNQPTP